MHGDLWGGNFVTGPDGYEKHLVFGEDFDEKNTWKDEDLTPGSYTVTFTWEGSMPWTLKEEQHGS